MTQRYARMDGDAVAEVFDFDPKLHESLSVVEIGPDVEANWLRAKDGSFAPPKPVEIKPFVPDATTKLGLKRALAETGSKAVFKKPEWEAVKAAISAAPDLQEDWDLALEIKRGDTLVQAMIAARKYTDKQVDALLIRSAELVA